MEAILVLFSVLVIAPLMLVACVGILFWLTKADSGQRSRIVKFINWIRTDPVLIERIENLEHEVKRLKNPSHLT